MIHQCKCGCNFEMITPPHPTVEQIMAVRIDIKGIEKYLEDFEPSIKLKICSQHRSQITNGGKTEIILK